jgi:hypothetical protein
MHLYLIPVITNQWLTLGTDLWLVSSYLLLAAGTILKRIHISNLPTVCKTLCKYQGVLVLNLSGIKVKEKARTASLPVFEHISF